MNFPSLALSLLGKEISVKEKEKKTKQNWIHQCAVLKQQLQPKSYPFLPEVRILESRINKDSQNISDDSWQESRKM